MEVFKPHLHAFGLKALVSVARDTLGAEGLAALLQSLGVRAQDLEDSNAWFSLQFIEAFTDELVKRSNDASILDRMVEESLSPKALGFIYPLVRAFGTAGFTYAQTVRSTPRFNKIGEYQLEPLGPHKIRLSYRSLTDAPKESSRYICDVRTKQLAAIPTLFDLPPAKIEHPRCMLLGADCCEYIIEWRERRARSHAVVGAGLGAAAVALLGFTTPLSPPLLVALTTAFVVAGWALGRVTELRRDVADRVQDLIDHQTTLARSIGAGEDRFRELLEAKAEVEKKVEERTYELRETSDKLAATLDEVQALDRAKTDFFNNVSHELRSPLTLILAPLEELASGRLPPGGQRAAYETMHRNASRLLRLINQLLDLAKIDAGEMKIAPVPTDLIALVRAALAGFEVAAAQKGVRLELQAPEHMPELAIDSPWIESALINLVANALRMTPTGKAVRISLVDHVEHVILSVSDDGPGLPTQDQKRVFERFAQADASHHVIGGTGIGLALVREAARLHGGDVELVSELGSGATFSLELPRSSHALAPLAQPSAAPASPRSQPLSTTLEATDDVEQVERSGPGPDAALALVAEDNRDLRAFIADALARRYRVRTACDGREAFQLATELRPEVVISDVAMPGMDGFELCRALRAQDHTRAIPIVLVTARADIASVLRGFEVGANDYLLKPFHATELLARTDLHVRLRRLTSEVARHERLAAVGSLAAAVAHNVRNPLSSLISGLPAIRARLSDHLDQPTRELMTIMFDCAERIERMTKDLLDLSRVDREASGDFAPGAGLMACARMLGARLPVGVMLRMEVDDQAVVTGRGGDMNHVFMNLMDNAMQAVDDTGTIEIRGVETGGEYVVTVGDSGTGIAPELFARVFEPFWTTRPAGAGTGLGLSLAKQIIDEHRGTIAVSASPLGGAHFTVRLPLRSVDQRAVA